MINIKRNENGITIIALILTVLLLVIITGTLAINTHNSIEISKLTMLEEDIRALRERVASYYVENNELPINNKVYTKVQLQYAIEDLSNNDGDNYYEIDLSKIDNITLNYNTSSDVYIVNEVSHNIYHLDGILYNGKTYHTVGNNETTVTIQYPNNLRLSKDYQEVDYIETNGTQYIDTGVICGDNSRIKIKFRTPEQIPTNSSTVLFYSGASNAISYGFAISSSGESGKYRVFRYGTYTGTSMLQTSTDYTIDFNKEKLYINDNLEYTFSSSTFTSPYTMPLFGQYYNSESIQSFAPDSTRIYYVQMWDNDTLIRNLIPCIRISDSKTGLYDTVNNVFYTNENSETGDFTAGPIVVENKTYETEAMKAQNGNSPLTLLECANKELIDCKIYGNSEQRNLPIEFQEVDYIETNGSQYIDTNVICNNNSRIKIKFRTPQQIPTNSSIVLFYAGSGSVNYGFAIGSSGSSGKFRAFRSGTYTGGSKLQTLTDYTIDFNKTNLYINNTLEHTFGTASFTVAYTMPLFGQYYNNSNSAISLAPDGTRIYYVQMWDNDILIRNLIPCIRISDSKTGLYDTVNNEFYTNANIQTGEFEVGANTTIPTSDRPMKITNVGDLVTDTNDVNYGKYKIPIKVNNVVTNIYLDEPLRKVANVSDYIDLTMQKRITKVEVIDDTGELPIEQSFRALATPIEETINFPSELSRILLNEGTNIISVETEIQPSNVEAIYWCE